MGRLPLQIEERIRRRERAGRNIRIGKPRSIFFQNGTKSVIEGPLRPDTFNWECSYINEVRYLRTGVNTAVSRNSITIGTTDSGNGTFNPVNLTWTDASKSWTVDQWTDYYLKVADIYYLILSNTATILTLDGLLGVSIPDAAYTIVPFKPNQFQGHILNPDASDTTIWIVFSNSETEIVVDEAKLFGTGQSVPGTVTTGDDSSPYTVFIVSAFTGYPDSFWDDFDMKGIYFESGNNEGEMQVISSFTGSTGEFTMASGFTNAIVNGDTLRVVHTLKGISIGATFRIESGYLPDKTDFENALRADIHYRLLQTSGDGKLRDFNFPKPFVARYSAEIYSESTKTFTIQLSAKGGVRVYMVNLATGMRISVYAASLIRQTVAPITLNMQLRTWYRIEVYLYMPDRMLGGIVIDSLAQFVYSWRDITPTAPTWVSVTGANSSNVNDPGTMKPEAITAKWTNNPFLGSGATTELWDSNGEAGTFVFLGRVGSSENEITQPFNPGTTRWFKLRHVTASGVLGVFTSARKGVTHATALANTQIDLQWVDGAGDDAFPNENGWFNDAVLKAKITVTTGPTLEIGTIWFKKPSTAAEDLGSSSPATSAAIVDTAGQMVQVMVEFTNGSDTGWIPFPVKYDKTAPPDPAIDNMVYKNFALTITLNAAYAYPSDFLYFQFHWDTDNTAPDSDLKVMRTSRHLSIVIPVEGNYELASTFYFWIRAVDESGNAGSWVNTSALVKNMEITSSIEVKDLMEFSL